MRRRRLDAGSDGRKHGAGTALFTRQANCSGSRAPSGSSRAADRTSPPRRARCGPVLDELDRLAEVDRLAVLEHARATAAEPSGARPPRAAPSRRRCSRARGGRRRSTRSGHSRDGATGGGGSVKRVERPPARCRRPVDLEERLVESQRPQVVVEVDPDALGLVCPPRRRGASSGASRGRRDAARPRPSSTCRSSGRNGSTHVELGAAHDPEVRVGGRSRVESRLRSRRPAGNPRRRRAAAARSCRCPRG